MSKQATLFGGPQDGGVDVAAMFETWWKLWPKWRKIDKKRARVDFAKALKEAPYDTIYDGAKKYVSARVAWHESAPDFSLFGVKSKKDIEHGTRHPNRWLNDQSWNNPVDEPPHVAQKKREDAKKVREEERRRRVHSAAIEVLKRHGEEASRKAHVKYCMDNGYEGISLSRCATGVAEILEPDCLKGVE